MHTDTNRNHTLTERKAVTESIPVIKEELHVSKQLATTSEVELKKSVVLENETLELQRTDRTFDIERRAVGQLLDTAPASVYQEQGSTIYRVVEEVPVVVTKYCVVEEIVVTPRSETTIQPTVIPVHKEHIDVIKRPIKSKNPLV